MNQRATQTNKQMVAELAGDVGEILEQACLVKGEVFLRITCALFNQLQTLMLITTMEGLVEEESADEAKNLTTLIINHTADVMATLAIPLNGTDAREARNLAEQMYKRQLALSRRMKKEI